MGASNGGTDIPTLILNKYFGIPISTCVYILDIFILAAQIPFSDRNNILYAILQVLIYSTIIDKLLLVGKQRLEIKIISSKSDTIKEEIFKNADRGVTIIHGEGGYLGTHQNIVLSVMSSRELSRITRKILSIDSNAFLIISRVSNVIGNGFD